MSQSDLLNAFEHHQENRGALRYDVIFSLCVFELLIFDIIVGGEPFFIDKKIH